MRSDIRKENLQKGTIVPLTFDYVFTALFNKVENIVILENFLSCYLEIPLEKIRGRLSLCSRDLELESKRSANKQVDLILEFEDYKINIELSNHVNDGIINRNIVFACNIHSRNLKYGHETYNNIGRTIQINLNHCHTNQMLKETYYLKNENGKILSEKFRIDFLDMVIGNNLCYTSEEIKLARWCKVFTSKSEEEFKKAIGDGLMEKEAKEKLANEVNKYSRDDEIIALYSAYTREELERNTFIEDATEQGMKQGMEKGMKQGIERGMKYKSQEIARNLLNEGFNKFIVSKATGLSQEEIAKLLE